jgi:hypothetical protein
MSSLKPQPEAEAEAKVKAEAEPQPGKGKETTSVGLKPELFGPPLWVLFFSIAQAVDAYLSTVLDSPLVRTAAVAFYRTVPPILPCASCRQSCAHFLDETSSPLPFARLSRLSGQQDGFVRFVYWLKVQVVAKVRAAAPAPSSLHNRWAQREKWSHDRISLNQVLPDQGGDNCNNPQQPPPHRFWPLYSLDFLTALLTTLVYQRCPDVGIAPKSRAQFFDALMRLLSMISETVDSMWTNRFPTRWFSARYQSFETSVVQPLSSTAATSTTTTSLSQDSDTWSRFEQWAAHVVDEVALNSSSPSPSPSSPSDLLPLQTTQEQQYLTPWRAPYTRVWSPFQTKL